MHLQQQIEMGVSKYYFEVYTVGTYILAGRLHSEACSCLGWDDGTHFCCFQVMDCFHLCKLEQHPRRHFDRLIWQGVPWHSLSKSTQSLQGTKGGEAEDFHTLSLHCSELFYALCQNQLPLGSRRCCKVQHSIPTTSYQHLCIPTLRSFPKDGLRKCFLTAGEPKM